MESRGFENREMICDNPLPEKEAIYDIDFKKDFIWATATAATQIEGIMLNKGKFLEFP